ncbi:MAG: glycosyltransferase family 2 protein [Firmicutes bacterium]|nr:glycosyltransferase family 2 protein [Bacillota bacterium]
MATAPSITVVMSTYNGAPWLEEQLASLLTQTLPPTQILVRDDGSTDTTPDIVRMWADRYPQIHIVPAPAHAGIAGSFSLGVLAAETPYVMLADQDDVWLADKIEKSWHVMADYEKRSGGDRPILVHSDLTVVDAHLQVMQPSFMAFQRILPKQTLPQYFLANNVTGCTVLMNRALIRRAFPIPPEIRYHDWWIALVAAAWGEIVLLPDAPILYRQHGTNAVGAVEWKFWHILRHFDWATLARRRQARWLDARRQVAALARLSAEDLPPDNLHAVQEFLALRQMSWMRGEITALKAGWLPGAWWEKAAWLSGLPPARRAWQHQEGNGHGESSR